MTELRKQLMHRNVGPLDVQRKRTAVLYKLQIIFASAAGVFSTGISFLAVGCLQLVNRITYWSHGVASLSHKMSASPTLRYTISELWWLSGG